MPPFSKFYPYFLTKILALNKILALKNIHLNHTGMLTKCPSVPQSFRDYDVQNTKKYYPIECDPTIPLEEKKNHMIEWWSLSENSMRGLKVSPEEIENVVKDVGPSLR